VQTASGACRWLSWVELGQNPPEIAYWERGRVMPSRGSPRRWPLSAIASYSGRGWRRWR